MQLNDLRCLSRVYCPILASSFFWSVMVLNCIGQFIKLEGDLVWVVFFVVFVLFALHGFIFSVPSLRNMFDGKVVEEKHYNLRWVLIEIVFLSGILAIAFVPFVMGFDFFNGVSYWVVASFLFIFFLGSICYLSFFQRSLRSRR
ncbi:hypothetical protein [Pseudomonas fluorescens]|uniref:hypothetical protein n=1 Tax=Pseudomonas fluorescens TaxID=294 RepID=UPI001CA66B6A|nr:hypothetical protein [Pseudomonas fluorescens]MBY8937642.1 hypothetical protein [Pseudomonas fluorescens]